ncbi:MAG: prepilin-type N-terminal cleavage/methylation domain-containing protein [Candidatus Omnitrophica bacterium]|nr:prepilin-type N-terminal cleavage/methylation domain-containing protein [Candidatus Omnitrophota bacterium]
MRPRLHAALGGEGRVALSASHLSHRLAGFSLLELLITVLIVGILAALALPNFGKAVEKAKVKDVQSTLAAIAAAERVYRLDQGGFGTLANLTANNYASDPDAGNANTDWNFAVAGAGAAFAATATRTGGAYNTNTVQVDQDYTGASVPAAPYNGRIYDGNHPLRD